MLIKSSKNDVIWNYIGIVISMGSNLLLLPFMIHFLNSDHLGLWYVYLSIGGIVTLFDFGFNPTFARNIAYCWSGAEELTKENVKFSNNSEPNYKLLKKTIKTCKFIYLIISSFALLILLTVGSAFIYKISFRIIDQAIVISWLVYVFSIFLNIYYGYYASLLRGVGAVAEYNKINISSRLIQIVISLLLLFCGFGIIAVAVAYLFYGFLFRFLSKKAFFSYRNLQSHLDSIHETIGFEEIKSLFFVIWHNAWRDGIVFIANYCASQAGTLIVSNYFTLKETGIYSISVQLITAIVNIAAALYTAYQPAMQSAYATNNKKEAKRLMATAMVTYFWVFIIFVLLLLTIGIPIIQIIKPDSQYDRLVIVGIAIYHYFYRRQSFYASFISNTNCIPYMTAYIVTGVISVVLSVFLVRNCSWGLWGLIAGLFIPQALYNCWKWPYEVFRMLGTNSNEVFCVGNQEIIKLLKRSTIS